MADLAIVFHWSPPAMDGMTVSDLMGWRAMAEKRSRPPENTGKRGKR